MTRNGTIPNSKVSKYHLVTERFLRRAIAELSTASKNQTETTRIATPQTGLMSILPWLSTNCGQDIRKKRVSHPRY